jgi:excisionase family DNA binding protein
MNTNTRGSDAVAVAATKTLEPQFDRKTYTIQEAADLLGIGRSLAYELAQEGILPGVKRLGRRYLVSRAALDTWLESPPAVLQPTAG